MSMGNRGTVVGSSRLSWDLVEVPATLQVIEKYYEGGVLVKTELNEVSGTGTAAVRKQTGTTL